MSNTVERVEAFACSVCRRLHATAEEGEACCRCAECATKFAAPKRSGYGSDCDHCAYGLRLRSARADVRRCDELAENAHRRLDALLAEKKPAKGTVES